MNRNRPNVLLITADQLRFDMLNPVGAGPHTPHLDALAAEGMRFTNAYSHLPVCGPSRQSLHCGLRPETFGGLWNAGSSLPVASISPDAWTWTRALQDAGYRSAFLGKWGVHPHLGPTHFGYDEAVLQEEYRRFRNEAYPGITFSNGFFGEPDPVPAEDSPTHWLADRAAETIRRLEGGGEPWHVALHFAEPHLPCRPAGRFADMYDPDTIAPWPSFAEDFAGKPFIQRQQLYSWGIETYEWSDWAPIVARYYGVISQLDEAIGRVLRELAAIGASEHTIVVFTADHGDTCGAHRMIDKHYIMYDDVVRVPMIVRWPGVAAAGTVCESFVYNFLDIPPTIVEAAGLGPGGAPEPELHGRSLLPLLRAEAPDEVPWRNSVVSTYNGQQFGLYCQRMLRGDRWKYVWNLTDVDELYDMKDDPAELRNLAADDAFAPVLAELRRELYERLREFGDGFDNGWMRKQLLEGRKAPASGSI